MIVPWNAGWTAEERYEIRPCRWADGQLAMWQPHLPNQGKPIFAKPHIVRQRQSVRNFVCTVCGKSTPENDRYWFGLGRITDGYFMTTESPVHHECAQLALKVCPHLRGKAHDLAQFPKSHVVFESIIGGPAVASDFGLTIGNRKVVGYLKFGWPMHSVRFKHEASP